jgi:superfamily II DNA or RNA helicase
LAFGHTTAKMAKSQQKKKKQSETKKRKRSKLASLKKEYGCEPNAAKHFDWSTVQMKVPLQKHQEKIAEAIQAQKQKWGETSHGVSLDVPMGFGKTVCALNEIIEDLRKYGNEITQSCIRNKVHGKTFMDRRGYLIVASSADLRNQWLEEIKSKVIHFVSLLLCI